MIDRIKVRTAKQQEDECIAQHFYQMCLDNDLSEQNIAIDWQERVLQFIETARRDLNYQAFVAISAERNCEAPANEQIVGSVSCQKSAALYPIIFDPSYRCDGYIWGVYVEPVYRRQGIGAQLTQAAIAYLQSIGCTHAVLNASPFGKSVYAQLEFVEGNLMRLPLQTSTQEQS